MKKRYSYWILVLIVLLGVGVVIYFLPVQPEKPVEWTRLNALREVPAPVLCDQQDAGMLNQAINNSLRYFEKVDEKSSIAFGDVNFTYGDIRDSLLDFKSKLGQLGLTDEFFHYIQENYFFFQGAASEVLFTGYYEADLRGSLQRSGRYRFPLYRKPKDLYRLDLSQFYFYGNQEKKKEYPDLPPVLRVRLTENQTLVPYYSREEIDFQGKLVNQDLELVWVDNLLDLFFLHIQGSGIVELDTGSIMRVNYEESNGHPYRAIGRVLLQRGILTPGNVSMQSIRSYLETHPGEIEDILCSNPSYVFFRQVEEGPMGCLGVPVTAYRSIATDRQLFPPGALVFIETRLPVFDKENRVSGWKTFKGFVLNQDTGGAIRTPGRVDLFTGYGEPSRLIAGHMKERGRFYFLMKKKNCPGH